MASKLGHVDHDLLRHLEDGTLSTLTINDTVSDNLHATTKTYVDTAIVGATSIWDRAGSTIEPDNNGDDMKIDEINEDTLNHGVDIESVHLEDQVINNVTTLTASTSVTVPEIDSNAADLIFRNNALDDTFSFYSDTNEIMEIYSTGTSSVISTLEGKRATALRLFHASQVQIRPDARNYVFTNTLLTIPSGAKILDTDTTATRLLSTNGSKQYVSTDIVSWIDGTANEITVTDDTDGTITLSAPQTSRMRPLWNGMSYESYTSTVTSDGANISVAVAKSGGGNFTVQINGTILTFTAGSLNLTAGTDTSPTQNYVWIYDNAGTATLNHNTTGFPVATAHVKICTTLLESVATVQTQGSYSHHNYNDGTFQPDPDSGHIQHINYWIRDQHCTWDSGVNQTLVITPNGGSADNIIFSVASGITFQLHLHDFPAITSEYYVVNDNTTAFLRVTDLNALLTDSAGVSMSGKYFNLIVWANQASNDTEPDCKLYVNLPSGSYNTQALSISDASNYTDFSIPTEFRGTGFLISHLTLRHQAAASGTWTSIQELDLRGSFPSQVAGTVGALSNIWQRSGTNISSIASGDTLQISNIQSETGTGSLELLGNFTQGNSGFILNRTAQTDSNSLRFSSAGLSEWVFLQSGTDLLVLYNDVQNENCMVFNASTSDVSIPNSKLTVSGNVLSAGLQLGGGGVTAVSIIDDDSMSTASATNLCSGESIKAYVDASGGGAAFNAYDTAHLNITGDGTQYTLLFNAGGSPRYDTGTDFSKITGQYTVPSTGFYSFGASVELNGVLAAHNNIRLLIDLDGIVIELDKNKGGIAGSYTLNGSIEFSLTVADIVVVKVAVSNSTKVVDIGATETYFYGHKMF